MGRYLSEMSSLWLGKWWLIWFFFVCWGIFVGCCGPSWWCGVIKCEEVKEGKNERQFIQFKKKKKTLRSGDRQEKKTRACVCWGGGTYFCFDCFQIESTQQQQIPNWWWVMLGLRVRWSKMSGYGAKKFVINCYKGKKIVITGYEGCVVHICRTKMGRGHLKKVFVFIWWVLGASNRKNTQPCAQPCPITNGPSFRHPECRHFSWSWGR